MPLTIEDYIGAYKDNAWIRDFIDEWQLDRKTGAGDSSLSSRLQRYSAESPDSALALLVALAEHSSEPDQIVLAEELEEFLHKHGSNYWEILNTLCSRVPQFRTVMANVWGASLPKDIKRKIEMWRS
jgi:hypothetical protein